MRERVVVVLGAGNLRCAPQVLASLAVWRPDDVVDIRLWDANEERLDLFDRFLRACLEKADTEHSVRSSAHHEEELSGATDIVFSVHEDCARRLSGRREKDLFVPEEALGVEDQVRGDPNKPTHPESLSLQTRVILSSPLDESEPRETVVGKALTTLIASVPASARILSLQRGGQFPSERAHISLDWPPQLDPREAPLVPHQVLRWIHGEESLSDLLAGATVSPMAPWLSGDIG